MKVCSSHLLGPIKPLSSKGSTQHRYPSTWCAGVCDYVRVCVSLCISFYCVCVLLDAIKDFVLICIVKNPFPYNSNTILKVTDGATNMISDVNGLCGLVRRALE